MQNQDEIIVGLDIGTSKVVAIVGEIGPEGNIEVVGIGRSRSLGVHRGVVNNITQTIQSIQQAVEQAEANSGLKIGSVTVGIAGQHIRSLQHSDYITRPNSEEVIGEEDLDLVFTATPWSWHARVAPRNRSMLPGRCRVSRSACIRRANVWCSPVRARSGKRLS